uniref:Pentapeptide repeat-containing protein n=1 Tax=Candidatus Kentrum sp. TC TaxID=2126339 RepID=A0A450YAQ6_9GAMM|nr:MAG: Pentapeptide repeat-containing protein [Candidatus Kentron sp. TC]
MHQLSLLTPKTLLSTNSLEKPGSYVGIELEGYHFSDDNLDYQFMNGVSLRGCLFKSKKIRHTEVREALFQGCQFIECDLTSSDFVYSKLISCIFINCRLDNGEWLESEFTSCHFYNSIFNHTTMNLTIFNNCKFDKESSSGLGDRSVSYNVFNNCKFEYNADLCPIVDRNFGIISPIPTNAESDSEQLLTKMSYLLYSNRLTVNEFVNISSQVVYQLLKTPNRSYLLKIKYLSLICRSYLNYQRISPLGIQRLEKSITQKIQQSNSNNEEIFVELTQLIMTIRLIFGQRMNEIESKLAELDYERDAIVVSSRLYFAERYTESQVHFLQEYIEDYCDIDRGAVKYSVKHRSTEILSYFLTNFGNTPVNLAVLLGAYLSALTLFNVTVQAAGNIKRIFSASIGRNEAQAETKSIQRSQNIIKILVGKHEGEIALKTEQLSHNEEQAGKVLEIGDSAQLEITIQYPSEMEQTKDKGIVLHIEGKE